MGMTSDYGTAIPRDSSSSDYGALPARFNAPGYQPFRSGAKPSVYASAGDFSGSGSADTLVGGAGGLPGGADRLAGDFNPLPVSGVTFMPGGVPQGVPGGFAPVGDPANPGVVPAGDPPPGAASTGGVPYATDPMRRTAGFTNIGNGVMQTPAPKPSLGMRIARQAVPAVASMLAGPGLGMLASVIARSAFQGSLDKTQPYRGALAAPQYAPAAPNPYGGYTTGSSYSASPFTPSGAGWQAPSFDPISGGPLYATNPLTHTYVDSQGRTHSYEPG
jgi:hypothetical protein